MSTTLREVGQPNHVACTTTLLTLFMWICLCDQRSAEVRNVLLQSGQGQGRARYTPPGRRWKCANVVVEVALGDCCVRAVWVGALEGVAVTLVVVVCLGIVACRATLAPGNPRRSWAW